MAVSHNLGVAVLSRLAVASAVAEGTLCAPSLHHLRFERTFRVVYHRNKYLTPAMRQFVDTCLKNTTEKENENDA